jgi:hypothetical protein
MSRAGGVSVFALSAVVLVLAGCGGSGESDETPAGGASAGPLERYFEDVVDGLEDEAGVAAEQQQVEEVVARCMAEQGFEYQPVDQSQAVTETDVTTEDPEKFAAESGYGFSVPVGPSEEELAETDTWVDPNQEYVEAMSESEQAAYYEALYGEMASVEYDEDAEMPEYDPSKAGCQGAAEIEVRGDQNAIYESAEFVAFGEAVTQLEEDVAADPRLKEADAAWSECMADAGFSGYATPQEAMDDMMERSNALWQDAGDEGPSAEQQSAAQELERSTAVADYDCKQEVEYDERQSRVREELENAFIEEHRAELERIRDLVAGTQK